jgi:hypothetical protein
MAKIALMLRVYDKDLTLGIAVIIAHEKMTILRGITILQFKE